jgi:hypothetical protein
MPQNTDPQICIYCGGPVHGVRKGEHVIPRALGAALTIKTVCRNCNNAFSEIDRELCSRSPLSIVASQELDSHLWQVWDVDHESNDLLLEARPDWEHKCFALFPQIIFEHNDSHFRGDYEEMQQFGFEGFASVLARSAVRAFQHHKFGKRGWLNIERVDQRMIAAEGYSFPPRIFSRHSIRELADRLRKKSKAAFDLRYLSSEECRHTLNVLDNWNSTGTFRQTGIALGSYRPPLRCFYDAVKVLRALAKIALNVLSVYCPNTPLNSEGFQHVIQAVRAESPLMSKVLNTSGFARASGIGDIAFSDGHSIRLLHMDREWHVTTSYFSGRIGTLVRFSGPNNEPWSCADIQIPLRSPDWKATTSTILQPLRVQVEWKDISQIIPSIEIDNVKGVWRSE